MVNVETISKLDFYTTPVAGQVIEIPVGSWQELPKTTPVISGGALPCAIMYYFAPAAHTFLVGHFYDMGSDAQQQGDSRTITKEGLEGLKKVLAARQQVTVYKTFLSRLGELVEEFGPNGGDLLIFGQNYGFNLLEWNIVSHRGIETPLAFVSFVEHVVANRFHLDMDLKNQGIPRDRIRDFRQPTLNMPTVSDSTIYDPQKRTIFHSRFR